jgi:sRNA-binding carbon storage regulator CsrA
MLKLDVRVGESVSIGDGVVITLEKKSGQLARIAFHADPKTRIRKMQNIPGIPEQPQI